MPKPHATFTFKQVKNERKQLANPEKAEFYPRFFRTGAGQYGEGDKFIEGVVPNQRSIARKFKTLPLTEIKKLLDSPLYECRFTGLLILVGQFEKSKSEQNRKTLYSSTLRTLIE